MSSTFSVQLVKLIQDFNLEKVYLPENYEDILISSADVNRPGLQLVGFFDFFDPQRIQIMGKSEFGYLDKLSEQETASCLEELFRNKPPVIIVARGLEIPACMLEHAETYGVPILRTNESTSAFSSTLISELNVELAPRITRHGVLVEVYGEGMLILGESGVGKSEAAMELIKRGHRLIADDAVEIRRVSAKTLVGTSPDNIRHFMELRGIGIINARRLFGMGAIKATEKIDLVVQLELWDSDKVYDRMGLEEVYTDILGIKIPTLTIPVKPGRNLAVIMEVAAMNHRQKKMGYNAAYELLSRLGMDEDIPEGASSDWDNLPV